MFASDCDLLLLSLWRRDFRHQQKLIEIILLGAPRSGCGCADDWHSEVTKLCKVEMGYIGICHDAIVNNFRNVVRVYSTSHHF